MRRTLCGVSRYRITFEVIFSMREADAENRIFSCFVGGGFGNYDIVAMRRTEHEIYWNAHGDVDVI